MENTPQKNMDFTKMSRRRLQQLCKKAGIKANTPNKELIEALSSQYGASQDRCLPEMSVEHSDSKHTLTEDCVTDNLSTQVGADSVAAPSNSVASNGMRAGGGRYSEVTSRRQRNIESSPVSTPVHKGSGVSTPVRRSRRLHKDPDSDAEQTPQFGSFTAVLHTGEGGGLASSGKKGGKGTTGRSRRKVPLNLEALSDGPPGTPGPPSSCNETKTNLNSKFDGCRLGELHDIEEIDGEECQGVVEGPQGNKPRQVKGKGSTASNAAADAVAGSMAEASQQVGAESQLAGSEGNVKSQGNDLACAEEKEGSSRSKTIDGFTQTSVESHKQKGRKVCGTATLQKSDKKSREPESCREMDEAVDLTQDDVCPSIVDEARDSTAGNTDCSVDTVKMSTSYLHVSGKGGNNGEGQENPIEVDHSKSSAAEALAEAIPLEEGLAGLGGKVMEIQAQELSLPGNKRKVAMADGSDGMDGTTAKSTTESVRSDEEKILADGRPEDRLMQGIENEDALKASQNVIGRRQMYKQLPIGVNRMEAAAAVGSARRLELIRGKRKQICPDSAEVCTSQKVAQVQNNKTYAGQVEIVDIEMDDAEEEEDGIISEGLTRIAEVDGEVEKVDRDFSPAEKDDQNEYEKIQPAVRCSENKGPSEEVAEGEREGLPKRDEMTMEDPREAVIKTHLHADKASMTASVKVMEAGEPWRIAVPDATLVDLPAHSRRCVKTEVLHSEEAQFTSGCRSTAGNETDAEGRVGETRAGSYIGGDDETRGGSDATMVDLPTNSEIFHSEDAQLMGDCRPLAGNEADAEGRVGEMRAGSDTGGDDETRVCSDASMIDLPANSVRGVKTEVLHLEESQLTGGCRLMAGNKGDAEGKVLEMRGGSDTGGDDETRGGSDAEQNEEQKVAGERYSSSVVHMEKMDTESGANVPDYQCLDSARKGNAEGLSEARTEVCLEGNVGGSIVQDNELAYVANASADLCVNENEHPRDDADMKMEGEKRVLNEGNVNLYVQETDVGTLAHALISPENPCVEDDGKPAVEVDTESKEECPEEGNVGLPVLRPEMGGADQHRDDDRKNGADVMVENQQQLPDERNAHADRNPGGGVGLQGQEDSAKEVDDSSIPAIDGANTAEDHCLVVGRKDDADAMVEDGQQLPDERNAHADCSTGVVVSLEVQEDFPKEVDVSSLVRMPGIEGANTSEGQCLVDDGNDDADVMTENLRQLPDERNAHADRNTLVVGSSEGQEELPRDVDVSSLAIGVANTSEDHGVVDDGKDYAVLKVERQQQLGNEGYANLLVQKDATNTAHGVNTSQEDCTGANAMQTEVAHGGDTDTDKLAEVQRRDSSLSKGTISTAATEGKAATEDNESCIRRDSSEEVSPPPRVERRDTDTGVLATTSVVDSELINPAPVQCRSSKIQGDESPPSFKGRECAGIVSPEMEEPSPFSDGAIAVMDASNSGLVTAIQVESEDNNPRPVQCRMTEVGRHDGASISKDTAGVNVGAQEIKETVSSSKGTKMDMNDSVSAVKTCVAQGLPRSKAWASDDVGDEEMEGIDRELGLWETSDRSKEAAGPSLKNMEKGDDAAESLMCPADVPSDHSAEGRMELPGMPDEQPVHNGGASPDQNEVDIRILETIKEIEGEEAGKVEEKLGNTEKVEPGLSVSSSDAGMQTDDRGAEVVARGFVQVLLEDAHRQTTRMNSPRAEEMLNKHRENFKRFPFTTRETIRKQVQDRRGENRRAILAEKRLQGQVCGEITLKDDQVRKIVDPKPTAGAILGTSCADSLCGISEDSTSQLKTNAMGNESNRQDADAAPAAVNHREEAGQINSALDANVFGNGLSDCVSKPDPCDVGGTAAKQQPPEVKQKSVKFSNSLKRKEEGLVEALLREDQEKRTDQHSVKVLRRKRRNFFKRWKVAAGQSLLERAQAWSSTNRFKLLQRMRNRSILIR